VSGLFVQPLRLLDLMQSAARRPINLSRSRRQQPNGFAKPRVRPVRHHVSIALAAHRPRRRGEPPRFLCDCCLWHRRCTEALPPLQQRPDDARCFVRLCHRGNTGRAAREYSSKPSRAGRWLRPDVTEDRCRAEHQKAAQISVASLRDAGLPLLPAAAVLPRHEAEPGSEVPSRLEVWGFSDDRHDRRRRNGSNTWNCVEPTAHLALPMPVEDI